MDNNVVNNFVKVTQEHKHVVVKGAGGLRGVQGPAGAGLQISGSVATYADLPWQLTIYDAGKAYFVQADGLLYVWTGERWPEEGQGAQFQGPRGIQGPPGQDGEPGPANSLSIGVVQGGATAGATITGTPPNQTLNLTLPKGDPGEDAYIPTEQAFKDAALNIVYPIGSIYMSVNNVSPETFMGGTWEQIEDKFLLSAGSTHTAGETGGSETHTHTVQIKRRVAYGISGLESSTVHSFDIIDEDGTPGTYSQGFGTFASATMSRNNASNSTQMTSINHDGFGQTVTGDTYSTSTLPPYLTVYMWKRTA